MKRTLRKWVSTVLIAAICAGFIVLPERDALAEDRPRVDLVVILADATLMNDSTAVSVREDLKPEFPGEMQNISLSDRVRRYADDIQTKLSMSKVIIVPVDPNEEPWKIQEALAKLYTEGDGTANSITKLKGIVMVGSVPLPLVTKSGRSFVSLYPYTDFEDPSFAYDFATQQFLPRTVEGRPQPEVWHGVIPYPISWEQYVREQSREQELSKIRREQGVNAYTIRVEAMRQEYTKLQRDELAGYFDKNHSFYTKGSYSLFSKKALIMDIFREFQAVSDFGLSGYQAYLENWDNKSYMRYTREWLADIQKTYFAENNTTLTGIYGTNPDGSATTPEQFVENAKKEIQNNYKLSTAEKEKQISDLEKSTQKSENLQESLGKTSTSSALIPDIFTRSPIEEFLQTAVEVFSPIVSTESQYFRNTGRWSFTGDAGDREGFTLYKMVQTLDETSRKDILEVNTALEKELDGMLEDASSKSMHMQLDIPTAPINYFGRYTSYLWKAQDKNYLDSLGDAFNFVAGGFKFTYLAGHWFYLDLQPTPPKDGLPITVKFDALNFLDETEKTENNRKYIPYTGQQYTEVVHHMQSQKQSDIDLMMKCMQASNGVPFSGIDLQKDCTILFDNPSPGQVKFIELKDPKSSEIPADKQLEVYRYQTSVALQKYLEDTAKPDVNYVGRQLNLIGDINLIRDFGFFIAFNPPEKLKDFSKRVGEHANYLYKANERYIQFQVVVHVIDLPFSAQQCTIYLGGAPEQATLGDQQYPLYLRGATSQSAAEQKANSWDSASGNNTGLQSSSNWRQEKVQEQVTLSLSSQEKKIRQQEMEIQYTQKNPPRGDNVSAEQMEAWRERLRQLKEEKARMEKVRDYARTYFTEIWGRYYGLAEGDTGRFGQYLEHVATLEGQTDLSKLVEANRLYDQGENAILRSDNPKDENDVKRLDAAASLDPAWFGYEDLRLDKRPKNFSFPDWFDFNRNGYWGGCAAPNLRRVEDSATRVDFTGYRADMETIFQTIRDKHIQNLKNNDHWPIHWLAYFISPLASVATILNDTQQKISYYATVALYQNSLYGVMYNMVADENFKPSVDSQDSIEASVAAYKTLLQTEKDLLLRDLNDAEYEAVKKDLRAITNRGVTRLTDIEKAYQRVMSRKAEERAGNPERLTLDPKEFGIDAPLVQLAITDNTSRDAAKNALYDLVQGQYELRLLKTSKITPATLQSLKSMGSRSIEAANAAVAAIDGELQQIIATSTIAEALEFVGITCDPQRALEPIYDVAGGKALTDPGYIPLRTSDKTVKIQEVNTLAPIVVSGNETWSIPGKKLTDAVKSIETYAPSLLPALKDSLAPTWKVPVLDQQNVEYPSGAPADHQTYSDDYPKTRDDVLYNPAQAGQSYEQGWEYTRKGFVVSEDQPANLKSAKPLNQEGSEVLTPETSYLACMRYAKYGMDPNQMKVGQPTDAQKIEPPYYGNQYSQDAEDIYPTKKDTVSSLSSVTTLGKFTAWPLVNTLLRNSVSAVNFSMLGHDATDEEKNALLSFLKDFERTADSEAGGWRPFTNPADDLRDVILHPIDGISYKGKWDFKFDYVYQLPNKLEEFFKKSLAGSGTDVNNPNATLYSVYGARRIGTVITHKEPTNETIAKQLQSMSATSLPVNNPRYVDFYLYEPVPQFNRFGEVEKWNEYEEHISIPYVNFFRAFPDQKQFSYPLENDRAQFTKDINSIEGRLDGIVYGLNNYLVDYIAKTSMSGPRTGLDVNSFTLDTSDISDDKVRNDVNNVVSRTRQELGQNAKNPQEMQTALQQALGGGVKQTTSMDNTALEDVSFDKQRFERILASTSLADGASDKAQAAKKKLAFAVYWEHMTLAEKYKYVLHNYLTSAPKAEATDMNFWQQKTDYTSADGTPKSKVGFESATIVLPSAVASKMQIPLEQIQGSRQAQGTLPIVAVPVNQVTIPEEMGSCDQEYRNLGGSKFGVPIEHWGSAITCWATHLWPLQDSDDQAALDFKRWGADASKQTENFLSDTGRFFTDVKDAGVAAWDGAGLVVKGVGGALESASKFLNDKDNDGLATNFPPYDNNDFDADNQNEKGENKPNGFADGQDKVDSLRLSSGRESVVVSAESQSVVSLPKEQKGGVIPYGSGEPLEVSVMLQDKNKLPLLGDSVDFVRLEILPEDASASVITLPTSEQVQRVNYGQAVFRVYAKNASTSFGVTRLRATLIRQKLPNSTYKFEPTAATGDYAVTVTPEQLAGVFHRIPCSIEERNTGKCARGDVRSGEVDSIFSTNETAHLLSLVTVDKSKKDTLVERSGRALVRYYKNTPDKANLYTKAMGGREAIDIALKGGTYAAALAVPKESGKYFVEILPEEALNLAPQMLSFLVVDTTYTSMQLQLDPPVAIEGQEITLRPKFLNFAGEEVDLGIGQASLGIPKKTDVAIPTENIKIFDGLPGGDTDDYESIDFAAGKLKEASLIIPDSVGVKKDPYTIDLLLSKIAPLSQITTQAGSLDAAISQGLVVKVPLTIYPKDSVSVRATLLNGEKTATISALTAADTVCLAGAEASASRAFTVTIELRDKAGRLVPYTGPLNLAPEDLSLFAKPPTTMDMVAGKGSVTITPSRKAGTTKLNFQDAGKQFQKDFVTVTITPGPLAALQFTSHPNQPLEAVTEQNATTGPDTMLPLRYSGLDLCGNPVGDNDATTIALDIQPAIGDGKQMELLTLDDKAPLGSAEVQQGSEKITMKTQRLLSGRNNVVMRALNFRGEATLTLRALTTDAAGKTVINQRITADTVNVPVRLTLRKELLESLEPNILYTNLLGGPYGDVTQKDFIGGWWMLTGKTQVVTTSTIASEAPANLAKVLPNGAIDMGGRSNQGLNLQLFAQPKLEANMPFSVDIKDGSDGATVMQVRYNVVPFASGAVYENYANELAPDQTAPLTPGIYIVPAANVTTRKDLLPQNRSVVRFFVPGDDGAQKESAILADNMQFFPGGGSAAQPVVALDTTRLDIMVLGLTDEDGRRLATIYVKLDPQRVFPTDGDYKRDVQLSLDALKADAVKGGAATVTAEGIGLGDEVAKRLEEAQKKAPQLAQTAGSGIRYLRKNLEKLETLDGIAGGVFTRSTADRLLKIVQKDADTGLYVGDKLVFPLRDLNTKLPQVQAWLGANILKYQLELTNGAMRVAVRFADNANASLDMLSLLPVYGTSSLEWKTETTPTATAWYLSATQSGPYRYATSDNGLRVIAPRREDIPGVTANGEQCSLSAVNTDVIAAGILPSGETFTCADSLYWERFLTNDGKTQIHYTLKERGTGSTRLLTEAYVHFQGERAFRMLTDGFTTNHQALYVTLQNDRHVWNPESGQIIRKDALPNTAAALAPVLNLTPISFLQIPEAANGLYRTRLDAAASGVPTVWLDEYRDGTWSGVVSIRFQLQEKMPETRFVAAANATAERAKTDTDVLRVYLTDTNLVVREEGTKVRVLRDTTEVLRFNRLPFVVEAIGNGYVPELLDLSHDRFQIRLKTAAGAEALVLDARYNPAYTRILNLPTDTNLPQSLQYVPGLYVQQQTPLLRVVHSTDRTLSRVLFGFEEVMTVNKSGGQRIVRPDLTSVDYEPGLTSNQYMSFSVKLFGMQGIILQYAVGSLPFDLRLLTYVQEQNKLLLETATVDQPETVLRPRNTRAFTGYLSLVGRFVDLSKVQESLTQRNNQFKNTTLSLPLKITDAGYLSGDLTFTRRDAAQSRSAGQIVFVPTNTPESVRDIPRNQAGSLGLNGLAILRDNDLADEACVRSDSRDTRAGSVQLLTCRDSLGVRILRRQPNGTTSFIARIRHDGAFIVTDDAYEITTRLDTGSLIHVFYTLKEKNGGALLEDVVMGGSTQLASYVRRGSPETARQAVAGTYVSYIATPTSGQATYALMQDLPGVSNAANSLQYCANKDDTARTCQEQLSFAAATYLQRPDNRFVWTAETSVKDTDGFTLPTFGYDFQPASTRIATLTLLFRDTPLTSGNIVLSASNGAQTSSQDGKILLRRDTETLVGIDIATGRLEGTGELRALSMTPTTVDVIVTKANTVYGSLRITRAYGTTDILNADTVGGQAGMYLIQPQNMLQVVHAFPEQSTNVQLGYDRLLTLLADGRIDIAIPDMVKTLLPEAGADPLRLTVNRTTETLDIGNASLVAFPLNDIVARLQSAAQQVNASTLQTIPGLKTSIDTFGNVITEAAVQRKGSEETLRAAQMRPVFAPTKPQIIFTATPGTSSSPSLPSFQLNPTSFYNAVRGENYTVTQKEGNLYFYAPSANPYWTSALGKDAACIDEGNGQGLAAVILHDGTRVICDPLHTIDLEYNRVSTLFTMTLRTRQQKAGASNVIGVVYVAPGDLNRYRTLTGQGNFQPEDVAQNFALQGIYAAVGDDYQWQNGNVLRLNRGDKAAVWSGGAGDFMKILTDGRVWNNSADRFYISFENLPDSETTLVQRRIPFAWNIVERRELRYTEEGSENWSGDVIAARLRMTLTDPAVTVSTSDVASVQNTPSFVCAPAQATVRCSVDAEGQVTIQESKDSASIVGANGTSSLPAVVWKKDEPARWVETGLWNGTTRFDAGDKNGIARLEVYGADAKIRAVIQYRPALQVMTPRVSIFSAGSNVPTLSTTQSEVQVLLATTNTRVIEKADAFVLMVDESTQDAGGSLLQVTNGGKLGALVRRLQNLDVVSFDGTTARLQGSVGQFGLSIESTRERVRWTIGDVKALLPTNKTWTTRSYEDLQTGGPQALRRDEATVEALKNDITLESKTDGVAVNRTTNGTTKLLADIPYGTSIEVALRDETIATAHRSADNADEIVLYDKQPTSALVHIAGNPRIAASTNALVGDPFSNVIILTPGAAAPALTDAGTAYIQPRDADVRLADQGDGIRMEARVGNTWQRIGMVNKRTLAVTLENQKTYALWQRGSTNLVETFIQDIDGSAVVRIRRQQNLPDLARTAFVLGDFPRQSASVQVENRAANDVRTVQPSDVSKVVLFGDTFQTSATNGISFTPKDAATLEPWNDLARQERVTSVMRIQPERFLVSSFDTVRYQVVAQTALPTLQRYSIYPVGSTTPIATITRSQPYAERYTAARLLPTDSPIHTLSAPGMLVRPLQSLVQFEVDTAANVTKVRYGFDIVGTVNANGELAPVAEGWRALLETARTMRSSLEGTLVSLFDTPYLRYAVRRNANGYDNNGVRNTMFVEARSNLGSTPITTTLGTDRPTELRLGNPALSWNREMVANVLSSLVQYTFEPSETSVLKFNMGTTTGALASLFIQSVADPSAADNANGSGTSTNVEALGTLPVDQATQALDILGGTGIYVQIRSPEKGLLSLAYEPSGDSSNNLYAVALRDASLPLQKQDQVNPQSVGVEDALSDEAAGLGYKGDFKNMLLFAGGNTVGESTLPYMSEALINLGDPVVSLKIEDADRSNESFTQDMGSLIYTHTKGPIQQMVLYDVDQDGREDIVFTDGDGILQVVRNEGGKPLRWRYLGGTLDIPEGIRELLLMQLKDKKQLSVVLGTPTQGANRTTKDGLSAVDGAKVQSLIEIKNSNGTLERCASAVPNLGNVQTAAFGDLDGDGTDDLVALTAKNEIKAVKIDPSVECGVTQNDKQRYTVNTVDTIGMKLDGPTLPAATNGVPAGYSILPEGDIYSRFNGPLTWEAQRSVCPQMDPSKVTPLYPKDQVPLNMPANPELVFIPEPQAPLTAGQTINGNDDISEIVNGFRNNLEGSEGVYFSYQGGGQQLMRMLVAADTPYIRSGGMSLVRYNEAFQSLAKSNPFTCLAGGFGGVFTSLANVADQAQQFLGFLTGPLKTAQFEIEESNAINPGTTLYTQKFGSDLNGGILQAGDTLGYAITISNKLPLTKNIDIADRFQQGTSLLSGSVVCQRGDQRFNCTAQPGSGLFGLYIPNIEVKSGETVTITYQAKLQQSPMPLSLQLVTGAYVARAVAERNLDFIGISSKDLANTATGQQGGEGWFADSFKKEAGINNLEKQKFISVSTPAMSATGSFVYWLKNGGDWGADILKRPPQQSPIMRIPVIGKILESLGLIWNDKGELDPNAKGDFSSGNVGKSTKEINNLLMNAFLASDRDMDGLVDLWDEDVLAPTLQVGDISRFAGTPDPKNVLLGAISDAGAALDTLGNKVGGVANGGGSIVNKFERSLDATNKELANIDCNAGGCSLIPADWNTAFFAPGTDAVDPKLAGLIQQASNAGKPPVKQIVDGIADQVAFAAFAAPTEPPAGFWPASGFYSTYDAGVKSLSQFRLYTSITLTGRFALTTCVGPYHVGMIPQPTPTGFELIKNCYSFILPDILNVKEFCRDIADGLSGLLGNVGRMVTDGGYSIARMKKANSITGIMADEPPTAFVADQFRFETERFKDPKNYVGGGNVVGTAGQVTTIVGDAVGGFLKDFRRLGRGTGAIIPANKRQPGFPDFIMRWLEQQIHEVLSKVLKLPTITLILPDPTLGVTRLSDLDLDTLEKRQAAGAPLTVMDNVQLQQEALNKALKTNTTEAELAKKKQRETEITDLKKSCEKQNPTDKALCSDTQRMNEQLALMDAAAVVNRDRLPESNFELDAGQFTLVQSTIMDDLTKASELLEQVKDDGKRNALQDRLKVLQKTWENPENVDPSLEVQTLPKTRQLLADIQQQIDPEAFQLTQLRSYNQLKQTEKERAALTKCPKDDPVGCALTNADQSYRQFMDGVNLQSGTSLSSSMAFLDVGVSSDQLLKQNQPGFSEMVALLSSLPFLNIQMRDVVFYYPWLPPDRISEFLYHLRGVKNESLEGFKNFMDKWAVCFNQTDAQGNAQLNLMLPPNFDLRTDLDTITTPATEFFAQGLTTQGTERGNASISGGASASVSQQASVKYYCLAAARVGQDAWAGLQGIDSNIKRIQEYGNIMNSMKQYIMWKTYIVGRVARMSSSVVNHIVNYVQTQNRILASWRDTIRSISYAIQTFQVLVDVFDSYQKQCTSCRNQRGTDEAQFMDLIGNFVQLQVITFPKWPDIELDVSNIRFRYDVVVPNIRLVPQQINLPRISPIVIPQLATLQTDELDLLAREGLNLTLPLLPALPTLPNLPDLPTFRLPKLPDLPPPPKVLQLNLQISQMVRIIGKILDLVCLVRKNVLPISESRVRSHIASLTTSPTILQAGQTVTTPTYEATLDRIRLSTQLNFVIDTNRPFGKDTYMAGFDYVANWWNDNIRNFILNPLEIGVRDFPQKLYGDAMAFVNREVVDKTLGELNRKLGQANQTLDKALQEHVAEPIDDFQATVKSAVEKKRQELSVAPTADESRKIAMAEAAGNDPLSLSIMNQMLDLESMLIEAAHTSGDTDAQSYLPEIERQVALLKSDDSGLPVSVRDKTVKRLEGLLQQARKSPAIEEPLDTESLPYVAGWRSLEKELNDEEKSLAAVEGTLGRLNTATTLEEFKSVLKDADMLAEDTFANKPVASLSEQDSVNTDSQRQLDALASQVGRENPMDMHDATFEKKIQRDAPLLADAPEVGANGSAVASNVGSDGAPLIAQNSGVTAAPAVTQVPTTVTQPTNSVAVGVEEEGAIIVELPNNGGLISLMNFIPDAETPVQLSIAPLRGDKDHPDAVAAIGADIYVKYNHFNRKVDSASEQPERYMGADRVRTMQLKDLLPVLPAVQGARVSDVSAEAITLRFDLPARTRRVNDQGAFIGDDARYVLRVYNSLLGREQGETPTDYVILPVPGDTLSANASRLQGVLETNEALMPEEVRKQLAEEATKQGLPSDRVLLGAVDGSAVEVTLPVRGRETPLFMTIVPRVATEDGNRDGLASKQLFAHPQRAQDTTAPVVTITGGETQVVPLESPLELRATATDAINDVVSLSWDTDLVKDSDLDGNAANDADLTCGADTPCIVPLTTQSENSRSKAATPSLEAPVLKKTWQPGDRGMHRMRVFAKDALGSIASRDVTLQVLPTEVRIDEYDAQNGLVRGSVYPPQANKTLQLLRVRDNNVSELHLPASVTTDSQGRFEIRGVTSGQGEVKYNAAGEVMQ